MSNADTQTEPRFANFERHFNTIIGIIIAALLGWFGLTTQNMSVRLAVVESSMSQLTIQVSRLREATNDRYTSREAVEDKAALQREIDRLEIRVNDLEQRVRKTGQ